MKKKFSLMLICLILLSSVAQAAPNWSDWAKESIDKANMCGILNEKLITGDFAKPVSRIEIAQLVVKAYENITGSEYSPNTDPFEDTFTSYAAAVYELGIMSGRGDGIFSPYDKVTRQEMSKIILSFKSVVNNEELDLEYTTEPDFTDKDEMSSWALPYVAKAYCDGIIKGYEDGSFKPLGAVSYQEAIILILRSVNLNEKDRPVIENLTQDDVLTPSTSILFNVKSNSEYNIYAYDVKNGYISKLGRSYKGNSFNLNYNSLDKDCMYYVFAESDGVFSEFATVYTDRRNLFIESEYYVSHGDKKISWNSLPDVQKVSVKITEQRNSRHEGEIETNTPYTYEVENTNYINFTMYPNCIYTVEISSGNYFAEKQIFCESVIGEKYYEILSSYPQSKEEADPLMVEVTVPVWKLSGNKKVPSKAYITVHKDIADKVIAVFDEIYNDEEKFPIKDVGGYNFRGGTTEHNGGTAIDINSNENYCIYSDGTVVGSHWLPNEDPYSIKPYGSVVRAFEKHGFTWGGDAWSSTKDYMHFSYLGT